MGALIPIAMEVIPLVIKAGMDLEPTIAALLGANSGNIEETKALLHQQRAAALAIINDTSRDVR
jgi:hypothetical protein